MNQSAYDNYVSIRDSIRQQLIDKLKTGHSRIMWSAIAMVVLGIVCIVWPQISSLAIDFIVGWVLLIWGFVALFNSFQYHGAGPFFGAFLTALLAIAIGVILIFRPGEGLLGLTFFIAAMFLVQGAYQMAMAFDIKPMKGWGWLIVASIASVILGIMIAAGIPDTAAFTIGLLVGINLLISGIALLMMAHNVKKTVVDSGLVPNKKN